MDGQCEDCIYWVEISKGSTGMGECHRQSPVMNANGMGQFPMIAHCDTCGMFRAFSHADELHILAEEVRQK